MSDRPDPDIETLRGIVLAVEECDRRIAGAQHVLDHPDEYHVEARVDADKTVRRYTQLRAGAAALANIKRRLREAEARDDVRQSVPRYCLNVHGEMLCDGPQGHDGGCTFALGWEVARRIEDELAKMVAYAGATTNELRETRDDRDGAFDAGMTNVWESVVCSVCGTNHDADESAACDGCVPITLREYVEQSARVRERADKLRQLVVEHHAINAMSEMEWGGRCPVCTKRPDLSAALAEYEQETQP